MKKAIIITVGAVLLTGAAFIFKISKNSEPSVETSVAMSNGSVTYIISKNQDGQTDPDIASKIDIENRAAQVLSELNWIDHAVVTVSDRDPFVAAILTVNREPSSDEANSAAYIISQYVDVDEDTDILITDQDSSVLYPLINQN